MVAETEKKDEKISLGSKILDYVPWRTALTVAAFAIPVVGPVAGTVVGTLAYGNYRKNNKIEDEESSKENAKPGRLEKLLSKAGTIVIRISTIAIGFLLGGPIGGIIAIGLMVVDGISGGKLIQGAEKILDASYDVLSAAGKGILDAGKWAVDKMKSSGKEVEKEGKPTHSFDNLAYFPEVNDGKEVDSEKQLVQGDKVKAELQRRENSANQEKSGRTH
ncbi:MAG: hypothetical protein LBJ80_02260 [Rickettsiales bacterium]|jgi:hypothetical protein|nr:hypothetical protein [Rickettsiales bacterium]MDR1261225.1 hypothetical protein [Rickettsiales bacterium]